MKELLLTSLATTLNKPFLTGVLEAVDWAYRVAYAEVRNDTLIDDAEKDYLYPHRRRCILERKLRDLANMHGLKGVVTTNPAGNYSYTEIIAQKWHFTVKHTSDERHMLKESIFRKQNAAVNQMLPQMEWAEVVGESFADSESPFSAIIYHATDWEDKQVPAFVRIGVPEPSFNGWAQTFDVYEVLRQYRADTQPDAVTEAEAQIDIKWKERAKRNAQNQ